MFKSVLDYFYKTQSIDRSLDRVFKQAYFKEANHNKTIQQQGYTIIKSAVGKHQLEVLQAIYQQLTQFKAYTVAEQFQNSGRFRDPEIRNFVMDSIGQFSKSFLPTLFDDDVYDENTTGAFQIKPPSKKSSLNPHQDAPVIDETKDNGLFVWIPLSDITKKNGAIMVMPGSHLWGNHERSLNVSWPLEPHTKLLWKHMHPIYLNKFDGSREGQGP